MSKDFKGIKGGNRSLAPGPVTVVYPCIQCSVPMEIVTAKPKSIVPSPCSTICARNYNQAQAQKLILDALGDVPKSGHIPQEYVKELIQANECYLQALKGRLRTLEITCEHCNHRTYVFVPHATPKSQAPSYCSWDCRTAHRSVVKSGRSCRTPNKTAYADELEATAVCLDFNDTLAERGDVEGVVPYACDCSFWHVGHMRKHRWVLASNETIAIIKQKTFEHIAMDKKA